MLDVMLPGLDGWEVLAAINAGPTSTHVPVVMLTGLSSKTDQLRAWENGVAGYITKPFGRDEVVEAIERALTERAPVDRSHRRKEMIARLTRASGDDDRRRHDFMVGLRRRTNRALNELAALVDSTEDAVIGVDPNGVVTSWNRAAEQIFHWPAE